MLSAVGVDANDCIYPIAYAIVEKENTIGWRWFVKHLGEDLKITNCNEWTFMTDRQKGLHNVLDELYPYAEHRFCVRHMYSNFFKSDFKGKMLKDYLWKAAKSTHVADYRFWMGEIRKQNPRAFDWLMDRPPNEWSKSHFSTKTKCDILLNNLCECFNKIILEDREMSILTMLVSIHKGFMNRIHLRRDKMRKHVGLLCPKIMKRLDKNMATAILCEGEWSGGSQYVVSCRSDEYVVDLEKHTCACRKWDLTGIPCEHGIFAILDQRKDPVNFVDQCYLVETYMKTYNNIVNPINGKRFWPLVETIPIKAPAWYQPARGRKQMKRRKQPEEVMIYHSQGKAKVKKKGRVFMTCSVCGLEGHNKRYHARRDAPREENWYDIPLERVIPDISSQDAIGNGTFVPQRGNTSEPATTYISGQQEKGK
ncbi:uncharacterized protein LOC127799830 [Diospyros lotus]|uniref:uncharacterized protein LOC127799830 n=1 Tax=Diospyros lotus TaxID=55363 RepID=UPI00224D1541|nr:uncharacterized protein LOC127799830 [Diospyros lotus]